MRMIKMRKTGELFCYHAELAKRRDIDVVEVEVVEQADGTQSRVEKGAVAQEPLRNEPPSDTAVKRPQPKRARGVPPAAVKVVKPEGEADEKGEDEQEPEGGVGTGGTGAQAQSEPTEQSDAVNLELLEQ